MSGHRQTDHVHNRSTNTMAATPEHSASGGQLPNYKRAFRLSIILLTLVVSWVACVPADYLAKREEIIRTEQALRVGGCGTNLSYKERAVDAVMLREKRALIEATRLNGSHFPARHNFLKAADRKAMEQTEAFKIIRKMPKGAVLHTHDESITSIEWLVKNVTYRPHCYMCVDSSTFKVKFHFFNNPPSETECPWRLVSDFRADAGDIDAFDQSLFNNISLVTEDPATKYPRIDDVWAQFMTYFGLAEGLMLYAPVFRDYLWEGLLQFRADNVQFLEIRGLLPPVYELNGTTHDPEWVLSVVDQVITSFVQHYPDFTGGRFIKTSLRFRPQADILSDVKFTMSMMQKYPNMMVGYDLVGQEDPNHSLLFYIDALLYPSQQNPPVDLPYFFHAGETDWQDTATDYNLVDAILLNSTRIGHGYALMKHPTLVQKVKDLDIAVEVNPISNQVLMLVDDPRNHPVTSMLALGLPVVISSDDNAVWEALPLTHDFYITFMTLTGEDTGLATLKQLANNSIRYSSLNPLDKQTALQSWENKWDAFIEDVYSHLPPA